MIIIMLTNSSLMYMFKSIKMAHASECHEFVNKTLPRICYGLIFGKCHRKTCRHLRNWKISKRVSIFCYKSTKFC